MQPNSCSIPTIIIIEYCHDAKEVLIVLWLIAVDYSPLQYLLTFKSMLIAIGFYPVIHFIKSGDILT